MSLISSSLVRVVYLRNSSHPALRLMDVGFTLQERQVGRYGYPQKYAKTGSG
jgi:hypothetical protein